LTPENHGDMDLAVKQAAALDLKDCKYSREQICLDLTALLGRNITVAQLDAIVAESKDHRFPLSMLPAWIKITGSVRILHLLCAASGLWLADETEHDFAELGKAGLRAEKLASRTAELKEALWHKA
jgi:hypothetical protein